MSIIIIGTVPIFICEMSNFAMSLTIDAKRSAMRETVIPRSIDKVGIRAARSIFMKPKASIARTRGKTSTVQILAVGVTVPKWNINTPAPPSHAEKPTASNSTANIVTARSEIIEELNSLLSLWKGFILSIIISNRALRICF